MYSLRFFLPSDEGRWPKAGGVDMRSIKQVQKAFGIKPPPPFGVLPLIRGGRRRLIKKNQKPNSKSPLPHSPKTPLFFVIVTIN